MTTAVAIREAGLEDSERISRCLQAAFEPYRALYTPGAFADTSPTPAGIRERFSTMRIFVAETADGEVVGTIACGVHGGDGHLRGMAVVPGFQGRAVADRLITAAEEALRSQGCTRVTLDATEPLARAVRFYERNGYARSGRLGEFFGMPLHEFVKSLV
jgi:ribosomal protein S18 acetylase RimI-like enzyme